MSDAVYLIRKKDKYRYEMAKFEDRREPVDIYTVSARGCSCPSRVRCKHFGILEAWQGLPHPEGAVLNERGKVVSRLF